jgi:hypothetical protein
LGAALGHLIDDTLIFTNTSFRDRLGLTDDVLSTVRLRHLLYLDQGYSAMAMAMENNDRELFPCALKSFAGGEMIPGRAFKLADGMTLLLLVPLLGDATFEGFIHGRSVGRSDERNRMNEFFHYMLSSKMMVASYFALAAHEKFSAGVDGTFELASVIAVLDEVIAAIVKGVDTSP